MTNIIKNKPIIYSIMTICLLGCDIEDQPINAPSSKEGVTITVTAPEIDGWSIVEGSYTRSNQIKNTKSLFKDEASGLDMEIDTKLDSASINELHNQLTTRWSGLDNNIYFRVVAYKCAAANAISASNYAGYGDYQLLTSSVNTKKELIIPQGTYTFICYSYGKDTAMLTFNSASTTVTATNGDNFMTYVKPNVIISNIGGTYTLSGIVFKHWCTRYRMTAKAQEGRMANITACKVVLPTSVNLGTYSFAGDSFVINGSSGSLNLAWNNPNGMEVTSEYTYLLPQTINNGQANFTITIGGKDFSNQRCNFGGVYGQNGSYITKILFTTEQGYIVGGAMWANGNLYKSGNTFTFYSSSEAYSSALSGGAYWPWNQLNPFVSGDNTVWNDSNDPCRQVTGGWRTPTSTELTNLVNLNSRDSANGRLFNNILLLPKCGYYTEGSMSYPTAWDANNRGLYRGANKGTFLDFTPNVEAGKPFINGCADGYNLSIRCVKQ